MSASKPYAGRDTGSRVDPFAAARLKLTFLYLAIITASVPRQSAPIIPSNGLAFL